MKKSLLFLSVLCFVVILGGCTKEGEDSLIWDFVNIIARVSVVDSDGNDLIAAGTIDCSLGVGLGSVGAMWREGIVNGCLHLWFFALCISRYPLSCRCLLLF